MQEKFLRVGNTVQWTPRSDVPPTKATIEQIELCKNEYDRYGVEVQEVSLENKNRAVFTLTNGHWAYGLFIEPYEPKELQEFSVIFRQNLIAVIGNDLTLFLERGYQKGIREFKLVMLAPYKIKVIELKEGDTLHTGHSEEDIEMTPHP